MADQPETREVHVKFWEHPVKRTEEEIAELRAGGLLREDPDPDQPAGQSAGAAARSAATATPAGSSPPGNGKKEQ